MFSTMTPSVSRMHRKFLYVNGELVSKPIFNVIRARDILRRRVRGHFLHVIDIKISNTLFILKIFVLHVTIHELNCKIILTEKIILLLLNT